MGAGDLEFRRMVLVRGRILEVCERVCFLCLCWDDWMSAEGLYGLGMVRGSNSMLATSCSTVYTCEFMSITRKH